MCVGVGGGGGSSYSVFGKPKFPSLVMYSVFKVTDPAAFSGGNAKKNYYQHKARDRLSETKNGGRTSGGVYVTCIYSHAR